MSCPTHTLLDPQNGKKCIHTWTFQLYVIVEHLILKSWSLICRCKSLGSAGFRLSTRCWTWHQSISEVQHWCWFIRSGSQSTFQFINRAACLCHLWQSMKSLWVLDSSLDSRSTFKDVTLDSGELWWHIYFLHFIDLTINHENRQINQLAKHIIKLLHQDFPSVKLRTSDQRYKWMHIL